MTTTTELSLVDLAEWAGQQTWSNFALSLARQFSEKKYLSDKQVNALRSMYEKSQAKQAKADKPENTDPVTEVGMYHQNGKVYRVKLSKAGRLYAMLYTPSGLTKAERFAYAPGAIYGLRSADRMTLEHAKELGVHHGICCVCGAELSDEKSVALGIGPVCIKRV